MIDSHGHTITGDPSNSSHAHLVRQGRTAGLDGASGKVLGASRDLLWALRTTTQPWPALLG